MMTILIETEKVILTPKRFHEDSHRPTITKWKGESMIRVHSMRASVREIVMKSKNRDVIKVGIVGEPHTGKSTQADTIGHLIHKIAKKEYNIDFAVRSYAKDEFMDIKKTLAELPPANYILKFGDLSFLKSVYGTKKVEELQQAMTEIRHLPGGQDVKIILVYDYHYTKGLPPYLRQSDFKYFTGVGSSEKENMEEIVSGRYYQKMLTFKKLADRAPTTEKFSFQLGNKGYFTYKYKQPFIPMLYWNEDTLRVVVSPTREWIDPLCTTCAVSDDTFQSDANIDSVIQHGNKNFGPGNFEAAIKLKLRVNGMNVYNKHVVNAEKWIDKVMEAKKIRLEDFAVKYGLTITNTKLRKSIDEAIK